MNATLAEPLSAPRALLNPVVALIVAAALGYGYVVSLAWHPYPASWLLKAMPALILGALALDALRGRERVLMVAAYLGAAAGDVFLDLDRTGYLRHGLACFLVTQVGFALVFSRRATPMPKRMPLVALLVAAMLVLLVVAWPNLGAMRIPVVVYLGALLWMTGAATMIRGNPWIGVGAVAFLVSDAMIGVSQFIAPFAYSTQWIVGTYVSAMLLIGRGMFVPRR